MHQSRSKEWVGSLIAALLLFAGILGLVFSSGELSIRFSEAVFISGFLTLAVDPFLKRRLLREASTDIFHHLLGFDLPIEIREKLKDFLLETRLYRKNVLLEVKAVRVPDGSVRLTWSMHADVVAAAESKFKQHLSFEEAERGEILEASITSSSHPELNYTQRSPQLSPEANEPLVSAWSGKEIKLKKGDEIHSFVKFATSGQATGFSVVNFGTAVINPRVRVEATDGRLSVFASSSDQRNGDEYIYRKVFVPSDHIQIRWTPVYGR